MFVGQLTENVWSPASPTITSSRIETTVCRVGIPGGGDLGRQSGGDKR